MNQTYQTKPTKPKLLVKAVNAWVRSAFGNVFKIHSSTPDANVNQSSTSEVIFISKSHINSATCNVPFPQDIMGRVDKIWHPGCIHRPNLHCLVCLGVVLIYFPARARGLLLADGAPTAHSGEGKDFLTGQLIFFTKTAVTLEQQVKKSIPRWEIIRPG